MTRCCGSITNLEAETTIPSLRKQFDFLFLNPDPHFASAERRHPVHGAHSALMIKQIT